MGEFQGISLVLPAKNWTANSGKNTSSDWENYWVDNLRVGYGDFAVNRLLELTPLLDLHAFNNMQ